jgi:tRNA pseudouridine55 synthase
MNSEIKDISQILLVNKPADWTSFDVVAKIRNAARTASGNKKIKVGHAGTLDPFATGLLIVLIGNETKNQDNFMKQDKQYEATLKLGFSSTTGDPEGEIREHSNLVPSFENVTNVISKFLGEITQTPPAYSAIKIKGKRAYEYARKGQEIEIKSRKIRINKIDVISNNYPELKIRVDCSSGTYIRTLAEDIGKNLGVGAYLTELRRTKIGNYSVNNAKSIDEVLEILS